MELAEANKIAFTALRSVLGAAHAFELSISGKLVRVTPNAPLARPWPKGTVGLTEETDGPWPPSIPIDCAWDGGRVTLEMRASFWKGSRRYNGHLSLQVVTSPLNREILWSTIAPRIIAAGSEPRIAVPVSLGLFTREGERGTRALLGALARQTAALGFEAISPAVFRLFDIVLADASVDPAPDKAFERVLTAALVKLPYVVRGQASDVEGQLFFAVEQVRPSEPTGAAPAIAEPDPAPPENASVASSEPAASTQENVFFDEVAFADLAGFRLFQWENIERINIIVGANDTGKSHLLKMMYVLARSVQDFTARVESDRPAWVDVLAEKTLWTFQPPNGRLGELVRHGSDKLGVLTTLCNEEYGFILGKDAGRSAADFQHAPTDVRPQPGLSALFFPPKEVLTSFDAIAAVREQLKRFGFDDTYYDLVVALRGEPIQVELPESFQRVLTNLETLLTGRIETDHGRFLFSRAGDRFEMPQVAEGIKKIGIFARLIQNGSLRRNSILFIDEPETNLHPHAARALVRMLYDLSLAGVQIYAATHSYFVLKQFEILARKHATPMSLCCLSRGDDGIRSSFFDLKDGMPDNGIVKESLDLYDEDVDVTMES